MRNQKSDEQQVQQEVEQESRGNRLRKKRKYHDFVQYPDDVSVVLESDSFVSPNKKCKNGPVKKNILTNDLIVALDRAKLSDRHAMLIISSVLNSVNHNLFNIVLNRESLRLERQKRRKQIFNDLKSTFKWNGEESEHIIVHWDTKRMVEYEQPARANPEKYERLVVVASSGGHEKLLSAPKLDDAKGMTVANAVMDTLTDWNLNEK